MAQRSSIRINSNGCEKSDSMLSISPTSIVPWLNYDRGNKSITLDTFLNELPALIDTILASRENLTPSHGASDPIAELFCRLSLNSSEVKQYTHFDESMNYTRNLVATDGTRYTMLLLCWNPGRESPIHDHPCDGCWMRVVQGTVQECRYIINDKTGRFDCYSDETFHELEMTYITDLMGYHKVGNPSTTIPAVTMHLYCPPFASCKIWLDPHAAMSPSRSKVCLHSAYGKLVVKENMSKR